MNNSKADYISQMVAETFQEVQGNLLAFEAPGSKQLEMDFSPTSVQLDQDRQCLIIAIEGETVEVPINFGSFSEVDFYSNNAHFYISGHKDPDGLLKVLSQQLDRPLKAIEIYATEAGLELEARFEKVSNSSFLQAA